jgi:hypothetical protein
MTSPRKVLLPIEYSEIAMTERDTQMWEMAKNLMKRQLLTFLKFLRFITILPIISKRMIK